MEEGAQKSIIIIFSSSKDYFCSYILSTIVTLISVIAIFVAAQFSSSLSNLLHIASIYTIARRPDVYSEAISTANSLKYKYVAENFYCIGIPTLKKPILFLLFLLMLKICVKDFNLVEAVITVKVFESFYSSQSHIIS